MRSRHLQLALAGVAWVALTSAGPAAQKGKPKPPPLADIPGDTVMDCAGPASGTTDGVCGDGSAQYVDQILSGGDTGVLVSLREADHQLRLRFDPAGAPTRALTLFIPVRLARESFECDGNCLAANDNGNPIANAAVTVAVRDGQDARIQTTMRDAQDRTIVGGPMTLGVGDQAPIDVLIGFQDPNGYGYRWALYWSPPNYPGSTPATITRTGACTWEIAAAGTDVAGLRLFNTGRKGKDSSIYEGRYAMPFRLTFSADAARMPGGCS